MVSTTVTSPRESVSNTYDVSDTERAALYQDMPSVGSHTNSKHCGGNGYSSTCDVGGVLAIPNEEGRGGDEGNDEVEVEAEGELEDAKEKDEKEEEDEEEEATEDEEEEDEDENEDEEPSLKYQRILGDIPDLLKKDSASAITISDKLMAMGTHSGIIHILDLSGKRIKSYKPHVASVVDIAMDSTADFVATASMDGQVVVRSLSTPESYNLDMKRPMRTVALEPNFSKRSTRAFVCGGLSGVLVIQEKGWLGHKESLLCSDEGPIWQVRWRAHLIAWANDLGVKIYDTESRTRITSIERPANAPRADLFKCTLHWQDDSTLLVAWADTITVARIRARPRLSTSSESAHLPPSLVEITSVFQLDCMISGIAPHPISTPPTSSLEVVFRGAEQRAPPPSLSLMAFLVVVYNPPEDFVDELTEDRTRQARKSAERPELRIISRSGKEVAADAISVTDYHLWSCDHYVLACVPGDDELHETSASRSYVVLSPKDLVIVKTRDERDHVQWLVERKRYEEALEEVEKIEAKVIPGQVEPENDILKVSVIGQTYIKHLVKEGDFTKAAKLCPKVCGYDAKRWEDWIFAFANKGQLQARAALTVIPFVPTELPQLGHIVYEMILAHFLAHDRKTLLKMIKEWPRGIYDIGTVIIAVRAELDDSSYSSASTCTSPVQITLMECLAELYAANRQPGKALPYFLRLRRPSVFDLIREHNLFTDVQDQVLLLVEFDHELMVKRKSEGPVDADSEQSTAINLLVDNVHSIPITRVVQQLQDRPYYLFLYLDALVEKDPHLVASFADLQVRLYAQYATTRLIDFLRGSNSYNLEMAYKICKDQDLVPEMVFLLGKMGNNKQALTLIIERLGDVHKAIDFAKEQSDDDLWEDLLRYSETRPAFILGLLKNVGVEISPIRLIRRIRNGLEIPGLKEAIIKILQDFHLQISLLEGCQTILNGDSSELSRKLYKSQSSGYVLSAQSLCPICSLTLLGNPQPLLLLFLCRHVVHAGCAQGGDLLPPPPHQVLRRFGVSPHQSINASIAYESMIRMRLREGCPACHRRKEGIRT